MDAVRFPGESASYREVRDRLLKAGIELKKKTEEGAADLDDTTTVNKVRLSELFGDKSTLVLYCFMYGPSMKAPCPLCTSFLDGLEGQERHLRQSVALAVAARSPLPRIRDFARTRPWKRLRLLSSAGTTYQRDYFGETDEASQLPMMNVFVKKDGEVHPFWGSEMLYASDRKKDGLDARHIDIMWPLWNVLDLTPEGRGATWYPTLEYSKG